MKILLIGKTGQLGSDIIKNNKKHEIYAPDENILDISKQEHINTSIKYFNPEIVINTAAFHNVLLCEKEWDKAFLINCIAVRNLASACRQTGALFVTFSTDYVFNGKKMAPYLEEDPPAPLQIYGISKAAGEFSAMSEAPENTIIIRTCGLYGIAGSISRGGNFVDKRIQDAKKYKTMEISCEQIVSPTATDDLSIAVLKLIECPEAKSGIYHLVNEGQCSWYEFTKAIYEIMGFDITLKPINRNGLEQEMRRPLYSALSNIKARKLEITLPHWKDAVKSYIRDKYKSTYE